MIDIQLLEFNRKDPWRQHVLVSIRDKWDFILHAHNYPHKDNLLYDKCVLKQTE